MKLILILFIILSINSQAGISITSRRNNYTGNGATSAFAYGYRIRTNTDLLLTVRNTSDVETTLTHATDYTVSGVGDATGGTVTLVNASQAWLDSDGDLLTDYVLSIRGNKPLTQNTDIRNQSSYAAELHENQFDNFTMENQQQQDQLDRSIKQPESEVPLDMTIPPVALRKSTRLGFDADGKPVAITADLATTAVSTFGATLVDDADAPTARTTLGISNSLDIIGQKAGTYFLGVKFTTVTDTDDTITITHSDGTDLSSTKPGFVVMADAADPGQFKIYTISSNISLTMTSAHYGMGGNGAQTEIFKFLYFINDNDANIRLGIIPDPGLTTILNTLTSATGTDINLATEMLVTATLTAGTWPCIRWGWVRANFNDTGDIWAGQKDSDDMHVGTYVPGVFAEYKTNTAHDFVTATSKVVDFEDKVKDNLSRVTIGSAWNFTAPYTKVYNFGSYVIMASTANWTAGEIIVLDMRLDTTIDKRIWQHEVEDGTANIALSGGNGLSIELVAGQKLDYIINQSSGSNLALNGNDTRNYCYITSN